MFDFTKPVLRRCVTTLAGDNEKGTVCAFTAVSYLTPNAHPNHRPKESLDYVRVPVSFEELDAEPKVPVRIGIIFRNQFSLTGVRRKNYNEDFQYLLHFYY